MAGRLGGRPADESNVKFPSQRCMIDGIDPERVQQGWLVGEVECVVVVRMVVVVRTRTTT
jgi:hypothetical protein